MSTSQFLELFFGPLMAIFGVSAEKRKNTSKLQQRREMPHEAPATRASTPRCPDLPLVAAPQPRGGGDGPTSEDTHGGTGVGPIFIGGSGPPHPLKKMGVGVGGPPGPPTPTPMVPRLRSDLVGKKVYKKNFALPCHFLGT